METNLNKEKINPHRNGRAIVDRASDMALTDQSRALLLLASTAHALRMCTRVSKQSLGKRFPRLEPYWLVPSIGQQAY